MRASIAVDADDVDDLRKMLVNYKASLDDLNESGANTNLSVHDNLIENEKSRIDRMIKKLNIVPIPIPGLD